MQKLVEGIHRFRNNFFSEQQRLFERLSRGQNPSALFIACSDSRICPNLLTQTEPGELFILRNAGNIVPPYGAVHGGEAATIEYAVSVLKVPDIVLCGHSQCGAMSALINPAPDADLPAVSHWLTHAEATKRIMHENYSHITDPTARVTATVEENVLVQIENLRTHPSVAAALSRGQLNLHGWVYNFAKGRVYTYDPASEQFVDLPDAPADLTPARKKTPAI